METRTVEKMSEAEVARLQEGTFVFNLTIGGIRTRAKVQRETVEKMASALRVSQEVTESEGLLADADAADELTVNKALLDVPEVKLIISEIGAIRNLIRRNGLPCRILKGGLYVYSALRLDWVERQVASAQEAIDVLLAKLEAKWPEILKSEEERLAPLGLFDARDYTTVAKIREATRLRYSWMQFDVPQGLQKINPKLFEAEREKARGMWREMFAQIRLGHAEILQDFVAKLRNSLQPGENGRAKTLRSATVDNLTSFLNGYALDDVTGFAELREKVEGIKNALRGVDAEVLRTEDDARARVAAQMAKFDSELQSIVIEQQRVVKLRD